jgi:hypothetical protein
MLARSTASTSHSSGTTNASVMYPWAIVDPNGPLAARSTSMWIHCSSPVAVANMSTSDCRTSRQPLTPRGRPANFRSSSGVPTLVAACPVLMA